MNPKTRMGLSIITSGLAFVGAANATDLIVNGSFEEGSDVGWVGYFKTYNHTDAYYTGPDIPESENPGVRYSWRHASAENLWNTPITQTVDLTAEVSGADIDAGMGQFTFSAWLASYGKPSSNPEMPYLTLQFLNESAVQVGTTVVIDRVTGRSFTTFADGTTIFDSTAHLHDWAKYERPGTIPKGARIATVGLMHSPNAGLSGSPDTYTDLVKLDVVKGLPPAQPVIGDVNGDFSRFSVDITETAQDPIDVTSLVVKLDGTAVTPTSVTKADTITTIVYTLPAGSYFPSGSKHTVDVSVTDTHGNTVSQSGEFSVIDYHLIPPTAKVQADTSKPGFVWRVTQNNALQSNDNERPEQQLAGLIIDAATGLPYDNQATPDFVGPALEAAQPADPTWAPLRFEIETVINMNQSGGGNAGAFTPDDPMPGISGPKDGIAGEITTYLDLPAGLITMGVNSDDGFRTKSGNPLDAFQSITLGEFSGGRGASDTTFSFVVQEAGFYAFRTVWEEGGGDANVEWFTVNPDGTKVLVNDVAHGGIAAYRATTTPLKPTVRSVSPGPAPRQLDGVSSTLVVELADGEGEQVDDASVVLKLDGKTLTTTKVRTGGILSLTYDPEGLQIPSEVHTGELSFKGTAGTVRHEQWPFRNLKKLILPEPKILETFDDYPEDSQPADWVAWNFTARNGLERNITDQKSASYEDWVLVDVSHISNIDGGNPYKINPGQFFEIGGNRVELQNANPPSGVWPEWLMSGNVLYAESDSRSNGDSQGGPNKGQTQFITTKPYDLSAFKDVVITFSSIYQQNQDSLGAVEYSVDGGLNWLPVMYFLEEPDIKLNADGTVNAVRTFNDPNTDTSSWVDNDGNAKGLKYGDGLGAPITAALGEYVVPRINDGEFEGNRVEVARLSSAAGKSDVRLRLAAMGTDSWYFAIDNLAFYDLASGAAAPALSVARSGNGLVITFEGSLETKDTINGNWVPLAGNSPLTIASPAGTKFYRAVR